MNPYFIDSSPDEPEVEIRTDTEADEFGSYVGRKKNQRRTRYALERNTVVILARRNGCGTEESCSRLTDELSVFPVTRYRKEGISTSGRTSGA